MAAFVLWLLLFVLCWPLALMALILYPIVWLLFLPFRIVGITVDGVLGLLKAILHLPSRLFGERTPPNANSWPREAGHRGAT